MNQAIKIQIPLPNTAKINNLIIIFKALHSNNHLLPHPNLNSNYPNKLHSP